ncbi:hypothetical protein ABT072_42215, partial [Streptomyces sp. NPDC002589]
DKPDRCTVGSVEVVDGRLRAQPRVRGVRVREARRGAAADDVVVAGGTVLQPLLYDAFTAALAETLPAARPRPLRVPPVDGAVVPARSLL